MTVEQFALLTASLALLFLVVVGAVCAWRLFREYKEQCGEGGKERRIMDNIADLLYFIGLALGVFGMFLIIIALMLYAVDI